MTSPADDRDWLSLREIDTQAGTPKGTAFRAFKRLEAQLRDNIDYHVLDAQEHREQIAALRQAGRLYASSIQVLMLSRDSAARLLTALQDRPRTQG